MEGGVTACVHSQAILHRDAAEVRPPASDDGYKCGDDDHDRLVHCCTPGNVKLSSGRAICAMRHKDSISCIRRRGSTGMIRLQDQQKVMLWEV